MWNDHWYCPAYFIIWFLLILISDLLHNDIPGPKRLYSINMWSTPAAWKQYNKFPVNFPLIFILFSLYFLCNDWQFFNAELNEHLGIYRVTHKGWYFRDDCVEFILSFYFMIPATIVFVSDGWMDWSFSLLWKTIVSY